MEAAPAIRTYHHPVVRPEWLALAEPEDIIEPARPIIDPHHHLWIRDGYRYFLDELLEDLGSGHAIAATVFLQCAWAYRTDGPEALRPVGETEFVVAIAEEAARRGCKTRVCAGIVAHADLTLGAAVDEVLAAQQTAAAGRLRGIRHLTARDEGFRAGIAPPPPAHLMGARAFRAGYARLAQFGLSYDAWLYHPQIPELTALARDVPGTPIVLNHLGGPLGIGPYQGRGDEVFATWRASIIDLASCPNVTMKLGGLAMMVAGFAFHERPRPPTSTQMASAWRPYFEAAIEAFGPNRCMFESNFSVDKAMCGYAPLWNAFKRVAAGASASEKNALFHDTAARFYRLG